MSYSQQDAIMKRTSSSGVKSLTMLKSLRISSGVLPLIMLATVLHPTSLRRRVNDTLGVIKRSHLQQGFDVKVVGGENDLKEHLLVNVDELLVPFADISGTLASVVLAGVGVWCR